MFWPNSTKIATILADVQAILAIVKRPKPTRIALEIPAIRFKKGNRMANFELKDDQIATVGLKTTTGGGTIEPIPGDAVFTATSSDPASLGVAIGKDGSGNPALILTPLVVAASNLTVTVNGNDGLASISQLVDIVTDNTPTNIVLDLGSATFASQPVPTLPGPG